MTQRDDSNSDWLPGELDQEVQDQAMEAWAIRVLKESVPAVSDEHLSAMVAIMHEEWERRHFQTWVITE